MDKMDLMGFQGLREMISIHPVFAHFPVALLTLSAVFYFLGASLKKETLLEAGKWTLWSGVLSTAVAVWTGWEAAKVVPHDEETHRIMLLHQNLGYVIFFLGLGLGAWTLAAKSALPKKSRPAFVIVALVLAALVVQQADLGGRMVFLKGAGVGKKSMLRESGHAHTHGSHDHD